MTDSYYYHAGSDSGDTVRWSKHTRRTFERATQEARQLARKAGGRPLVEYWDRSHGLRPGWDVSAGAAYVD